MTETTTSWGGEPPEPEPKGIYHPHADTYWKAGWANPFPLLGKAIDVPRGITGRDGRTLDRAEIAAWMVAHPDHNIALRLDGVVGIDVDNYTKAEGVEKRGWVTLQLAEARWGKLPATWRSSARPGASGIRFYRVPPGYLGLVTQLKLADEDGVAWADIEIIQHHHRYAVVWPSVNPDAEAVYRWYGPDDQVALNMVPNVADLPWLPEAWLLGLLELGTVHDPDLARDPVDAVPQEAPREAWHHTVEHHYAELLEAVGSAVGSRHDNTLPRVGALARDENDGLAGATTAMRMGFGAYVAKVQDREAESDFIRMVLSSRAMVAGTTSKRGHREAMIRWLVQLPEGGIGTPGVHTPQPDAPPAEAAEGETVARPRLLAGGAIFDEPEGIPALWGDGAEVLWAEGEPCMICAPPGVGKTTLAGQLVLGMIGLPGFDTLLGHPITPRAKVLYLASDRPRQIMRSLRRQAHPRHRALLDEHLVIWKGPPPVDLAVHPDRLVAMAQEVGANVVVLDSLKDMAVGITEDKVGAGINQAIQLAIAAGIDVLALHHQRKGQNDKAPKTLEDVYGSTWLTAGMGSVVLLWGTAGDPLVELIHLKQPGDVVGPLKVIHDHEAGRSTVEGGTWDPVAYLGNVGPAGATLEQAARAWFAKTPSKAEIERTRRRLDKLVQQGLVRVETGAKGGAPGQNASAYHLVVEGEQE